MFVRLNTLGRTLKTSEISAARHATPDDVRARSFEALREGISGTGFGFRRLAPALGLSEERIVDTVRQTADALVTSWPAVKRECPVPSPVVATVEHRLDDLPLLRG